MSDYKYILLTVDFFDYSQKIALKYQKLADVYQTKLNLLHVVDSVLAVRLKHD